MHQHRARRRAAALVLAGSLAAGVLAPGATAAPASPRVTLVATGGFPTAPVVNPATNKVYVANAGSDTLSVIDGRTNEVTNIPTSYRPTITLVNPRTNTIFVVTAKGLDVVDGDANRVVRTVPKLTGRLAAIDVVANRVYVTARKGDAVHAYDPGSGDVVTVPIGVSPSAMVVNEGTNRLYVANALSSTVTVYDAVTRKLTTVRGVDHPVALAVNPVTDLVYVANLGKRRDRPPVGRTLTVIDGRTNATRQIYVDVAPIGVAVDSVRNRVFVLSQTTYAVTVVDADRGKVVGSATAIGIGGLAVDERANRVYVGASPFVAVIDGDTFAKTRVDAGGRMMSSAVVNPATGKAYLNNPASSNVAVFG